MESPIMRRIWRALAWLLVPRGWDDPAGWFAVLALVGGLVMVFLVPPFQVMDEPNHLARTWQLAHGGILPAEHDGDLGGYIPANLQRSIEVWERLRWKPEAKVGTEDQAAVARLPLAPAETTFREFDNTALYNPVLYLPHVPGVWLGRIIGLRAGGLLRLARFTGLVGFVLLFTLVLRWWPFPGWPVAVIGLTPVTLFVASGVSADTMAIALAALFVAACLRLRYSEDPVHRWQVWGVAVLGVCLAVAKMAYAPLVLVWLVVPEARFGDRRKTLTARAIVLGAAATGFMLWLLPTVLLHRYPKPNVDALGQLQHVLSHPVGYLGVVWRTIRDRQLNLLYTGVGSLGWLDTLIAPVHFIAHVAVLFATMVAAGRRPPRLPVRARGVLLGAVVLGTAFTTTLVYLNSTPVAAAEIADLSGRYVIPFLPALAAGVCNRAYLVRRPRLHAGLLLGYLSVNILLVWQTLYVRYYG